VITAVAFRQIPLLRRLLQAFTRKKMVEDNGSDVLLDAEDSWSNCDGWNEGSVKFHCVLCPSEMETVQACFAHCSSAHSFDFKHIKNVLGLLLLIQI
jgi:hypothetical protein